MPRELAVVSLPVTTASGTCTIELTLEERSMDASRLRGARVRAKIDEPDDSLPDDRVYSAVREIAMVATHRVIHAARLLSRSPLHVVPVLHESEFLDFTISDETAAAPRVLAGPALPPRSAVVARTLDAAQLAATLAPLAGLGPADALWQAALEAACAGRTADAVVGARAALEAAWLATADAAVAEHKRGASPALVVFFDAYYGEATRGTTAIRDRLDRYSKALFGRSFADRWGQARWSQVIGTFATRNLAAHGAGAVSLDEAFQVVGYIRTALEDMAAVRAAYP